MKVLHTIPPIFGSNSKILILGSFPSVKSRQTEFFYGHPQNRFWKVLAQILNTETPNTVEQKKKLLTENGIALWDVIKSCQIQGSSDSSVKNVVPNDIAKILCNSQIRHIFLNGKCAEKYYKIYIAASNNLEYTCLPSTSPANAAYTQEKLCVAWSVIEKYINIINP